MTASDNQFRPRRGIAIMGRVRQKAAEDYISLIAAGVAFYGLLALFPAITACMAIAGLVAEPEGVVDQLEQIGSVLPEEAATIVVSQATEVAGGRGGGLGLTALIGVLIAVFYTSKGAASIIEGLNVAYDARDERGLVRAALMKYGLTLLLIVRFVAGLVAAMVLPAVLAAFGPGDDAALLARLGSWVILAFFAVLALSLLCRLAPDRRDESAGWLKPAAAIAALLWLIGSSAFAISVSNFGSYNETFGALGGVVILLMWLWLSAFIVLLGAELDSETQASRKQRGDWVDGADGAEATGVRARPNGRLTQG